MSLSVTRGERHATHDKEDKEESRVDKAVRWLRLAISAVREGFNLVRECLEIRHAYLELQKYHTMMQKLDVVEKGLSDDPCSNAVNLINQVQSIGAAGRRLNKGLCGPADERFDYAAGATRTVSSYIQNSSGGTGEGDTQFHMDFPRGNGHPGGSRSDDHRRAS